MTKSFVFLALILAVFFDTAEANHQESSDSRNPYYDNFYTVSEDLEELQPVTLNPANLVADIAENQWGDYSSLKSAVLSLLHFDHHNQNYGDVGERYNRSKHFGPWLKDHRDGECYNTRARVLIRESLGEVSFSPNGCTVKEGQWQDPYRGGMHSSASQLQIDHFVPLKNAYISGAHQWTFKKRCLYANFLGNRFHLIPVLGDENNEKSDKTPEGYMPPRDEYKCQYLAQWLKIKLIWGLGLTPPEKEKIAELAERHSCSLKNFQYNSRELIQQRDYIANNMELCQ